MILKLVANCTGVLMVMSAVNTHDLLFGLIAAGFFTVANELD